MGRLGRDHVVAIQAGDCDANMDDVVSRVSKVIRGIAAGIRGV